MNKDSVSKILVVILKIGLYASFVIPFITLSSLFFPYVYTKALLFQLLVEVLMLVYVPLLLMYPSYRPFFRSRINRVVMIFFAVLLFTTITSADRTQSFWGVMERGTGLFTLIHVFFYYLMLVSIWKDNWHRFLQAGVASGIVMALYALHQSFFVIGLKERSITTLGNPGFVGTYLLFFVYFTLIVVFKEKQRALQYAFIAGEGIILLALFLNATRGVFLGILVSILSALVIIPLSRRSSTKKTYIFVGCLLLLFGIGIGMLFLGKLPDVFYEKVKLFQRVRDISFSDNSRVLSWQAGFRGFMKRPILGYGPENFSIPFNRYYDPRLIPLSDFKGALNFDKAHNEFVERLITGGIVGFFAYAGMFIVIFLTLWSKRRESVAQVLMLLVIAYLVQNTVTFDTPVSYMLLMIALARAAYEESKTSGETRKLQSASPSVVALILPLFVIGIALSIFFFNIKPALASHQAAIGNSIADRWGYEQAYGHANADEVAPVSAVFSYYYNALEYHTVYSFDFARFLGKDTLLRLDGETTDERNMLLYIAGVLEHESRMDWNRIAMTARIYNILCGEDKEYCDRAKEKLARAEELAPFRYQVHSEKFANFHQQGNFKEARSSLERAFELGYAPTPSIELYSMLGHLYGTLEDYETSFMYYEKALLIDGHNVNVLESAALAAKLKGDVQKARELAQLMAEVQPETKERVQLFIESLK